MNETDNFFARANRLLDRWEAALEGRANTPDWTYDAYRWRHDRLGTRLVPVKKPHRVDLDDLLCMHRQKAEMVRNTEQFVRGRPANNALLWGARGTGKSTLIKAVFNHYVDQGLRLIEVEKDHLVDLVEIVEALDSRRERFLLYCDDLSFEADDAGYKSLKAVLEGSISSPADNVLIYASSNRRHLMPEMKAENQDVHIVDGEIHPGEAIEEKVSLSERFGLWLSFYPYSQDDYLAIVEHWLGRLNAGSCNDEQTRLAALRWAGQRGSRSGRVARQFAVDQAGRHA
ncbi:MAG: ATP-binding protein [Chromatiaceae bacterium]|nr:ATP-binding protein [Gammaproteobacteria bacterium]MCP5318218.1 ATP-binding protein [Chromatiaceae bacterium]MCW5584981.1 ATP-binding protein [Chromatiales bacterium]MCP5435039.1 ATP-binding protein [Chromatiaceae bacterium]HOP17414.1 ATP-binding protein [Gammaproteobacteria bacterium]